MSKYFTKLIRIFQFLFFFNAKEKEKRNYKKIKNKGDRVFLRNENYKE